MGSITRVRNASVWVRFSDRKGFTLLEILVVIGIIAILAAAVIVAINPGRQFAQARDSQRTSNVNAILNAIGQNIADNKGIFTCSSYALSASSTNISNSEANIRACIVPTYLSEIPYDPSAAGAHVTSAADYDTKYTVLQDGNGRITVCAPGAASETAIAGAASICVTR